MKLTKVSIRHFKSLSEVDVQLHPQVTVLVGPNAVGKSNFVDALRFMRDASKAGVPQAVALRDGFSRIRSQQAGTDIKPKIEVVFEGAENASDKTTRTHFLTVTSTGGLITSTLLDRCSEWKFSALVVATLRTLSTQDTDEPLRDDGSNWAAVILRAEGTGMLDRITEMMQVVLPDFQGVSVIRAGSYLVPQFTFGTDGVTRTFDPVQLSDGTLRIFAMLLSLYQRPAPPLLVIEEPELSVHPGVLAMLTDAFKEVSEVTQLIITTHSPHLVNYFAPEQIRVATMHNGLTSIRPIHPHQMEAVHEGLMSLEEFMGAEGLRPDDTQPLAP